MQKVFALLENESESSKKCHGRNDRAEIYESIRYGQMLEKAGWRFRKRFKTSVSWRTVKDAFYRGRGSFGLEVTRKGKKWGEDCWA